MNGATAGRATARTTAERADVEIRAEGDVGTVRLWGPCALCGRNFAVENMQTRLAARDRGGNRLGPVCPQCASAGENGLRERLLDRAKRLREKAAALEERTDAGVRIHPAAGSAAARAISAQNGARKDGL